MKSRIRNFAQRGYALVTVLIIASLFVALSGAIGTQVVTNLGATKKRLNSSAARYAAYAGLQHAILMLKIDPDWADNLMGVQMLGSSTAAYTVEVSNNRTGTGPITAPDGTTVPAGAVYCAALGLVNENEALLLHAMTGMLAERSPELDHGAFADTDLSLRNNAQSLSYDPSTTTFLYDSNGRAVPNSTNSNGDIGSNRYVTVEDSANVDGDVYSSVDNPAVITSVNAPSGSLIDLLDPVTVPDYKPPTSALSPQSLAINPTTLVSLTPNQTTTYEPLVVTSGNTVTVSPGSYYFPDGLQIDGEIQPTTGVSPTDPIIFFVGNDANFGDGALVNPGGETRSFQMYFVDHNDGTSQELTMSGNSQIFGTIVGSTAEGKLRDEAQLFGGFLGRGVDAEEDAQIVYDESLKDIPLGVASNWGLAGITEPPPAEIINNYPVTKTFIGTVEDGTATYKTKFETGGGKAIELAPR